MFVRIYLLALLLCLSCNLTANAQISTQLSQVTSESQIVSGRAYFLYYVSNAQGCYVEAEQGQFSVIDGYNTAEYRTKSEYYFTSAGNNTWKIQSKTTQKYIPQPTGKADIVPTDDVANAGLWTLNFLQYGIFAPYSGNYCFDRNYGKLHANEKDDKFPRNVSESLETQKKESSSSDTYEVGW